MFLLLRRLEVLLWNSKERGTKKKKNQETLALKKLMITLKWQIKNNKKVTAASYYFTTHIENSKSDKSFLLLFQSICIFFFLFLLLLGCGQFKTSPLHGLRLSHSDLNLGCSHSYITPFNINHLQHIKSKH